MSKEEIKVMIKDCVYSEDGITYMSDKQYNNCINIIEQLQQENKELKEHIEKYEHYCKTTGIEELMKENKKYKEVIDKAKEYINKYAWQEDIIGDIYTTTGKPAIDRYMQLEWDNCNELLEILKEVE